MEMITISASLVPNTWHPKHLKITSSEQWACLKHAVCYCPAVGLGVQQSASWVSWNHDQNSGSIVDLPRHHHPRATTPHQDSHTVILHTRKRFLPASVIAGNIPGLHRNSGMRSCLWESRFHLLGRQPCHCVTRLAWRKQHICFIQFARFQLFQSDGVWLVSHQHWETCRQLHHVGGGVHAVMETLWYSAVW